MAVAHACQGLRPKVMMELLMILVACRGLQTASAGQTLVGDIVTAVGGLHIGTTEDLASAVEQFNVGDQIPLTIQRDGERLQVIVPLL